MHSFLTLVLLVTLLLFNAHAQERNHATKSIHSSVADMINKASKKIDKTFVPSKPKPVPKEDSKRRTYAEQKKAAQELREKYAKKPEEKQKNTRYRKK